MRPSAAISFPRRFSRSSRRGSSRDGTLTIFAVRAVSGSATVAAFSAVFANNASSAARYLLDARASSSSGRLTLVCDRGAAGTRRSELACGLPPLEVRLGSKGPFIAA